MTTPTTEPTSDYLPGEALTATMTAHEYLARFAPDDLAHAYDVDAATAEIEQRGHEEARRLNIPLSLTGHYPPVVWELERLRNC
ncbi:hypothetical protein [Hyphomicrobium sp.]|uniref:hypothetical protein n=1 Tax=Hyphomicrobium sp. TaxID=82 RepID=UPI002FE0CB6E